MPLNWTVIRALSGALIILLLLFGGTRLGAEIKINQDLTRAKASLEILKEEIAKVELAYTNDHSSKLVKEVLIPNPINWEIISFSAYDFNNKPKECTIEGDCLCLCPIKTVKSPNIPQCEIKAACAVIPHLGMFDPILIHPTELTYVLVKMVSVELNGKTEQRISITKKLETEVNNG